MLPDVDEIAAIEAHAAGAWPATEVVERGGWLLRCTPALDRARSNSALPLRTDPDLDVLDEFYAARGMPACVQVSPLERHRALDATLEDRGWDVAWSVDVLTRPAADVMAPDAPVALLSRPSERWLEAWGRCEGRDDVADHAATVFAALAGRSAFALAPGGRGVGMAVASLGYCGIFCMATDEHARGMGIASSVLRALADWARGRGAQTLYLQVSRENDAAHALYAKHGFDRSHGYWFRTGSA